MVQKSQAAKQVHIAAASSEIEGIKLNNKDDTDWRLPPAKYLGSVHKMLSPEQKEWLWQDHKKAKANGDGILEAKKRQG